MERHGIGALTSAIKDARSQALAAVGLAGDAVIIVHQVNCVYVDGLPCTCFPIRFCHDDPHPSVYFAERALNPIVH